MISFVTYFLSLVGSEAHAVGIEALSGVSQVHFLTFSCYHRRPNFDNDADGEETGAGGDSSHIEVESGQQNPAQAELGRGTLGRSDGV